MEQSATSATLTLVRAPVNAITSCPPLVPTNNSLLFYSNFKPVKDFQQETLSLKHMPTILVLPKKDRYTSSGVNKNNVWNHNTAMR